MIGLCIELFDTSRYTQDVMPGQPEHAVSIDFSRSCLMLQFPATPSRPGRKVSTPPSCDMPRKKFADESTTGPPGQPAGPTSPKPRVFTVKVAKDLVAKAKKVAVLREQSQEGYITPVLAHCSVLVKDEIARAGIRGVRDRAEAIRDFSARGGFSTFVTDEDTATELASLAGQCLTSVAKLIDEYLRTMIETDYEQTLDELPGFRELGLKPDFAEFVWERIPGYDLRDRWGLGAVYTLRLDGQSLKEFDIHADDLLRVRRSVPKVGDTLVVWSGSGVKNHDRLALMTTAESRGSVVRLLPLGGAGNTGHLDVDTSDAVDRERIAGVLVGKLKAAAHRVRAPREKRTDPGARVQRLWRTFEKLGLTEDEIDDRISEIIYRLETGDPPDDPTPQKGRGKGPKKGV